MKTMIILAMLLVPSLSWCFVDYTYPIEGFTPEELKGEVLTCVSIRLSDMKTDAAVAILEEVCYYQVLNKIGRGEM